MEEESSMHVKYSCFSCILNGQWECAVHRQWMQIGESYSNARHLISIYNTKIISLAIHFLWKGLTGFISECTRPRFNSFNILSIYKSILNVYTKEYTIEWTYIYVTRNNRRFGWFYDVQQICIVFFFWHIVFRRKN